LAGGENIESVESPEELRRWIEKNMTADPANILRDMRERVARVLSVAKDGSVVVKPNAKFTARQKILAVFVGKLYSEAAGYSSNAMVTNPELTSSLNLPEGTVRPAVKELRDAHVIDSLDSGRHVLPRQNLSRAINELEESGI
jgi:hypothetical protein